MCCGRLHRAPCTLEIFFFFFPSVVFFAGVFFAGAFSATALAGAIVEVGACHAGEMISCVVVVCSLNMLRRCRAPCLAYVPTLQARSSN
jgi:hypothetical protein